MESHLVLTQNNLCRTCMTPGINLTSLFSVINIGNRQEPLSSLLLKCTSIQVTCNDVYPQYICDVCLEKLTTAYLFREQCYQAHERFGQLYQSGNVVYSYLKEDTVLNNHHVIDDTHLIGNSRPPETINDLYKEEIIEKSQVTKIESLNQQHDFQNCDNSYEGNEGEIETYSNNNEDENYIPDIIKHYDHTEEDKNFSENNNDASDSSKVSDMTIPKFSCTDCSKEFYSKCAMHKHMKVHSNGDNLRCAICTKEFTRVSDVKRHMSKHTGEKPYSCVVCHSSFTQSGSLAVHMRKHGEYKKVKKVKKNSLCWICGMSFRHSSSLTVHVRRHVGDKPYYCNICNMRFVSSGRLTSHMRVHTGERPFSCTYCGKRFAQSSVAGKHMKSHTEIKPYQCPSCLKKFSTLYYLNIHKRQHTGEKPHECNVCHKTFADPKNLKQHKNIHSENKPYLCIICGKSFRRSHHLKTHMNIHTKSV